MAKLFRTYIFDRAKINAEKRTAEMVFSTEAPVDRGFYQEVLDHGAVDMGRLKNSAPLLVNHNPDDQVGVVDAADIEGSEGRATVRFGQSVRAKEIFQDVQDGIRKKVSVGYERTNALSRTKGANGVETIRFAWAPFELSIASIAADDDTGIGRSQPIQNDPIPKDFMKRNLLFKAEPEDGGNNTPAKPDDTASRVQITNDIRQAEKNRATAIRAAVTELCKVYSNISEANEKFRAMADEAIGKGTSAEEFNADLLKSLPGIRKIEKDHAAIDAPEKDMKRYSLLSAIRAKMNGEKLEGIEKEFHDELHKRSKAIGVNFSANGIYVPSNVPVDLAAAGRGMRVARSTGQRDLNVTTASQGGDFVQTSIVTPIVEILRNKMVCERLGVQTLSGLEGNVAIPRQTGAATAYSLAESALLTLSTQAINQIGLAPHRIGATGNYTKQLILQSSVDVENFMRDDMMKVLAISIDSLILNGTGANSQPTGIFNTTGIGSVTFGAAATWAKVIAFESALALANADEGSMAYVVDPATRGTWKAAVKVAGVASFLWENNLPVMFEGPAPDYGKGTRTNDGVVNGYRAAATNQIANSRCLFGNFQDAILAMWGGFDVVVNPYSLDTTAEVRITVNTFIDVAVRHAASFCASTDSANQ